MSKAPQITRQDWIRHAQCKFLYAVEDLETKSSPLSASACAGRPTTAFTGASATSTKAQGAVTKVPARPLPPPVAAPPTSRVPSRIPTPPPPQTSDGNPVPPPSRQYPPSGEMQCVTVVPNLIGHDLRAAASMLDGLSIGNVARRRATAPPGFVIDQSPKPGTRMRPSGGSPAM